MDKLFNKTITVSSVEIKSSQFGQMAKLKDEAGKTYTVYEKKKDGSTSEAWKNLPAVGVLVMIGYASEMKEYEGKPYEARTIRSFNTDIANGMANHSAQGKSSNLEHSGASGGKSEEFWDKKAYKQCLWNYYLATDRINPLSPAQLETVWQVFKQ